MTAPSRPLLRWLGGKFRLAEWIVGQMPAHDIYLEPFGGAASVLMRKPRAYNEIINDLDDELVNLFRVLREREAAAELIRRLELTAYAEAEYQLALKRGPWGRSGRTRPHGWWSARTWPTGRNGSQHRSAGWIPLRWPLRDNQRGRRVGGVAQRRCGQMVDRLRGVTIRSRAGPAADRRVPGPQGADLSGPALHARDAARPNRNSARATTPTRTS
jgi:hypothetical protein